MCGISGIFSSDRQIEQSLKKMTKCLSHRGPDYSAIYTGDNFGLAHNRLSIIDLSDQANQPMTDNSERYLISFNGEIFNYKELRNDLIKIGCHFKTRSDTEVLLEGYLKNGEDFFNKIRGFFALCIYDKKEDVAILSRDIFGKKPLYYHIDKKEFIFGSEIKSILEIIKPNISIDYNSLSHFLWKGYYVDGDTAYSEIKSLLPGETLKISRFQDTLNIERSSKKIKLALSKKEPKKDIKDIEESLNNSIRYRFISDVPFSFLLSGGIDSSLITTMASDLNKEKKLESHFLGYGADDPFRDHAEFVSKNINSVHTNHEMKLPNFEEIVPLMLSIFDEPFGDYSAIPSHEIYKKVSKFNKVVISGDGADEMFAGYKDSRLFYLKSFIPSFNFKNLKFLSICYRLLDSKYYFFRILSYFLLILFGNDGILSMATYKGGWNLYYRKKYMTSEGYKLIGGEKTELKELMSFNNSGGDSLERYLNYDLKRLSFDFLVKVDRTSMKNSLEVRSPFLDKNFVEGLFPVNPNHLFSFFSNKKRLKELLGKYGLQKIGRTSKQGFTPPLEKWITSSESKKFLMKIFEDQDSIISQLFKLDKLKKILLKDKSIIKNKARLWFLMILYVWQKENF